MMFVKDVILEFISFTDLNDTRTNLALQGAKVLKQHLCAETRAQHGHKSSRNILIHIFSEKKTTKCDCFHQLCH